MFNHVIVIPTFSCNCRCPYCYEEHSAINMTDDVMESVKHFLDIQKQNGLKKLQLEFFGGEPTLKLETVFSLSQYAKDLFSNTGDKYLGSMTTNGTLLDYETFKQLNELGVCSFQITFDGPKHIHDKTRVFANNSGSYDVIWNNLESIRQSDLSFRIVLRIHVTPKNIKDVEQFSKNDLSQFRSDSRFRIIYKEIVALGGKNDHLLSMYNSRSDADKALEKLREQDKFESSDKCYAGLPTSVVILPNGDLSKCTVELDKGVVGKLLPDGTVQMDNNLFSAWCIGTLYPDQHIGCPRDFLNQVRKVSEQGQIAK
ncbi:MAG: radical SAM protein [Thermoguttaceae bacterium]|nr:radical SAM protein [Thermoguttaceae bacterium]